MEEEIKAEFINNGFTIEEDKQEDILKQCLTFCVQYKLSPPDLVFSWDCFSLNRGIGSMVKSTHIGAFLEQLQIEKQADIIKKEPGLHLYSNDVSMIINDEDEDIKEVILKTPTKKHASVIFDSAQKSNGSIFASKKPLDSVTPFGERKNKFVVQFTLNEINNNNNNKEGMKIENDHEIIEEDDIIKRVQPNRRTSLQIHNLKPEIGCRFMYSKIEDKFNFLENRINKYAKALTSTGLYEEPMDPSVASEKTVFAVGMICCEEEGRLKEKPILLQSSVEHSGGQRVRLDLQKVDQFSIFPGQVVGIEGHNPSGHCLIASKIIDQIPLLESSTENTRPTKKQAINQDSISIDQSLSLIIAAGPYTTSDNLFFEPLVDLLAYARRKQPQVLILLGPFIDCDHPEIKKGALHRSFDEMFRLEILGRIQDYVECMGSTVRVILVPAVRDAHHDLVFPQPPFEIYPPELKDQIHSITNPGTFTINKVNIACTTVDILKQLSAEEISRNTQSGSKQRLITLANHLLSQQSFYPLYPPSETIPIDYSLAPETLEISSIPDILILPSDLAHFVKVISLGKRSEEEEIKCICVNPSRLARGEGGGFFVEINYQNTPDLTTASVIRI